MIIPKDSSTAYFPVRCTDSAGDGVTGVVPSQISDGTTVGNVTIIKSDRTLVALALTNAVNWFEASATKAPGLYHILLPSSALNLVGGLQIAVFPAATQFKGSVFTGEVKIYDDAATTTQTLGGLLTSGVITNWTDAADATLGKWAVVSSGGDANRLILYRPDGTTVLKKFDLKDPVGDPTVTNPFSRTPV